MKKSIATVLLSCSVIVAMATNAELIVRKIDNLGAVPGTTYRIYAHLINTGQSLHAVWGDTEHPLVIESTAPFYQNDLGGYSSAGLLSATLEIDPHLAFDSYITLGYENSNDNDLWDLGIDFSDFDNGGSILTNNGAWFLIPTDEKCTPSSNGLVLIGQFTTSGTVSGRMNLQGWSSPQVTWQELDLMFTTENAEIFGCTDTGAANYNTSATYDDGTCNISETETVDAIREVGPHMLSSSWEIFPNPLSEDLIHIRFGRELNFSTEKAVIHIYDLHGKLISRNALQVQDILPGNKVTIQQELAAGTYKVVLVQGSSQDSKTLIVEH